MRFTENELRQYAAPLSETENQKCLNAIRMVRDSLKKLGFTDEGREITKMYQDTYAYTLEMRGINDTRRIRIFLQGSYANNTNVRTQSDVDIAVVEEDIFKVEYRPSTSLFSQSDEDYNFCSAPLRVKSFKDEVQKCLEKDFGEDVERKNKSIKIHGNTYRKDADTVPCRRYRDYRNDYEKNPANYVPGIVIFPDEGGTIINYPEQHIANGKKKNSDTNYYYKKMVRIIKKMRYIMSDFGIVEANNVSSFGLESLLWNLPDWVFLKSSQYREEFKEIVDYLYRHKNDVSNYKEANGIKSLCSSNEEAQNYMKFIDKLKFFYE